MGEVYKARDTRLDRTVAIKVLRDSLAADPEFRERFDREARTISQLDSPDICALFDVGEQDGLSYLVMQFLEGETLEARLQKGPLAIEQALQYAIQIGGALTQAHRAGIVHRDLKPGNVMLTKSGAKLLDFGLAKARTAVVGDAEVTLATPPSLTVKGTIVGTIQYMAPEQVEGLEADVRTDVFAFGAILYEMVTGRKAFIGGTPASLISAILKDRPRPIAESRPAAPPQLEHVVSQCLAKNPDERWQDMGDVTRELLWIQHEAADASTHLSAARPPRNRLLLPLATGGAGLMLGLTGAMLLPGLQDHRPPLQAGTIRTLVGAAPAGRLGALPLDRVTGEGRPSRTAMAWSPDGLSVVFSGLEGDRQMLYVRALDRLTATAIAGTEDGYGPFFSPDGRWIGFWSRGALRKVPVDGSSPATTICESPNFFGASWGTDDTVVFAQLPGLWRVRASGGTPEALAMPDAGKGELKFLLPQILPGSRALLFTITHTPMPTWTDTEVVAQTLATGERRVLVHGGADGRYVSSGHLLYVHRGTLMAAPFDAARLVVTGGAVAMVEDVMQAANSTNEASDSGAGQFSVSATGSLLYARGGVLLDPERSLVWVDRDGRTDPLALPSRAYLAPRISPDGRRVVLWTQGDRNVWVLDLARGVLTRLTDEGRNARATWSVDGRRIVYGSASGGTENLFWRQADGSGPPDRLTNSRYQHSASSWSPDGRTLLFMEMTPSEGYDIWALSAGDGWHAHPVLQTRFNEQYAEFSPDGRWMAYVSNESGQNEVYVQPYPGPGARQQVSTDGATAPAWSHDGTELFYTTTRTVGGQAVPTTMMVVPVKLHPTFDAGRPRVLFRGTFGASATIRDYDVTSDGRRFLMVQQKERPPVEVSEMILVQNWFGELQRKVPAR